MSGLLLLAKSGEAAKSGPIGLAIILILCIACYFLFKSMSRHLRTVREDFPTKAVGSANRPEGATDAAPDAATDTDAAINGDVAGEPESAAEIHTSPGASTGPDADGSTDGPRPQLHGTDGA